MHPVNQGDRHDLPSTELTAVGLLPSIDGSLAEKSLARTQCSELVNLACSMLMQVKRQIEESQQQSRRRDWKRKLRWVRKEKSEDISPEATKLAKSIERCGKKLLLAVFLKAILSILKDLVAYGHELHGYSLRTRISQEEEIKKRLNGFKESLTKSVESFQAGR